MKLEFIEMEALETLSVRPYGGAPVARGELFKAHPQERRDLLAKGRAKDAEPAPKKPNKSPADKGLREEDA